MRKIREYRGCELESPMYRQIVAEMACKTGNSNISEYRTKRGKQSNKNKQQNSLIHTAH
jgi:Tfp pilus assembly protein PilV|tara:strand:- start:232 stop:408 length:177 start_codon:yes stop_codon:yes gene_type:complete